MPCFLTAGQSNAAGGFTNNQSWAHASLTPRMWKAGAVAWATLADPTGPASFGSVWPRLATHVMAARGARVDFICTGVGSTFLDPNGGWKPGGTQYNACVATVNAAAPASIDALLWDQGEGETHNASAATQASYYASLRAMHDQLQIDVGKSFPMIVAQTGTVPSDTGATTARIDMIRAAQRRACQSGPDIFHGPLGYDRSGIHWETDAEALTLAARWWLAIEGAIYGGANGRGPYLVSAYQNAARDEVTLTFSKPLPFTTPVDGFAVTDNGVNVNLDNIEVTGDVISIGLDVPLSGVGRVTYASGNALSGEVPATGETITLPNGSTTKLPIEPIVGRTITDPAPSGLYRVPSRLPVIAS